MSSILVIYNPAAGRYSVKPFIKYAVRELESTGWKVDVAETQSGAHTIELAKQAAAEKKEAVFAIGGDLPSQASSRHVDATVASELAAIARAEGGSMWDVDGREYLDFVSGIAVSSLGHNHPALVAQFLDPGHFHAALTLRERHPRVHDEIFVYASAMLLVSGPFRNRPYCKAAATWDGLSRSCR